MILRTGNELQVSGNVTISSVSALFKEGIKLKADAEMVIDMAKVEKVDSTAVSLMLVWLREAERNRVKLRFTNVPGNLMSLARLYGVADLLPATAAV